MSALAHEKCLPCRKDCTAANTVEKKSLMKQLPGWSIKKEKGVPMLVRSFEFPDFKKALDFVDKIGAAADKHDHHPNIILEWGKATVSWNTHSIKNLHRNDFIMAAKTSAFYKPSK